MVSAIHNRTVAATSFASAEAAKLTLIGENGRSYDEAVIGSVSPAATATPAAAGPQPAAPATQPHLHAPVDELTLSDEIGLDQAPAPDALRRVLACPLARFPLRLWRRACLGRVRPARGHAVDPGPPVGEGGAATSPVGVRI